MIIGFMRLCVVAVLLQAMKVDNRYHYNPSRSINSSNSYMPCLKPEEYIQNYILIPNISFHLYYPLDQLALSIIYHNWQ